MRTHEALDCLIDLEERVARLYTRFFRCFRDLPGLAGLWWEMALEEYEHAGVLKMVKDLTGRGDRGADIQAKLRPLKALIEECERRAVPEVTVSQALGMAVRLERSELDRLGRETVRAIGRELPEVPRTAFAPHEAHLKRLMRTVRKFGGEEVARQAWTLTPEARRPGAVRAGDGRVRTAAKRLEGGRAVRRKG